MKKVLMFLNQGLDDLEVVTITEALGWTKLREHLTAIELLTDKKNADGVKKPMIY